MNKIIHVSCPHCDAKVEWTEDNLFRPFCSKRCKLIDFGDWANETNKISSDLLEDDDLMSEDLSPH